MPTSIRSDNSKHSTLSIENFEFLSDCNYAYLLLGYYLNPRGVHVVGNAPRGLGKYADMRGGSDPGF